MTLIERICAAEAGSRELDAEIHEALGNCLCDTHPSITKDEQWGERFQLVRCSKCGGSYNPEAPNYSTSFDCAEAELPDEWFISNLTERPDRTRVWITLRNSNGSRFIDVGASTRPLVVIAAAIQARAA